MNKLSVFLVVFIFILFSNGSCETDNQQYFITFQNKSDEELIFIGSYNSFNQDSDCLKPVTTFEYENFINDNMIKPNAIKKIGIDLLVKEMQKYPDIVTNYYFAVFNRIDVDTMSCELFKDKYPLKKEWIFTIKDLEANDLNLVFP